MIPFEPSTEQRVGYFIQRLLNSARLMIPFEPSTEQRVGYCKHSIIQ